MWSCRVGRCNARREIRRSWRIAGCTSSRQGRNTTGEWPSLESCGEGQSQQHAGGGLTAGIAHLHCGRVEDALAYFHRAIRLSPNDPEAHISLTGIAHAQMILGDYEEALVWAGRSLALNTTFDPTFWMLIAANAHLGRMDAAHRFLEGFKALAPDVTIASIRAGQSAKDPSRIAAILEGLRIAGLEEGE